MKICLVCSQGGHLTEILELMDAFKGHDIFLVTHDEKFTHLISGIYDIRTYLIRDLLVKSLNLKLLRIIGNVLIISMHDLKIFLSERPDVIVSTGSEIAIPMAYLAKVCGKKVIFIESLCRVHDLSLTGKLIYPIADLFFVQWENLKYKYKKSLYEGRVL
jgi:beta-1,4-N-acetylglucosaminyltransferase